VRGRGQEADVKVRVDPDLCEGHAKCQAAAPEVFRLGDDDLSVVIVDDVPEELRPKVERAIRLCPRQAIAWVSD
jgi:ferredoxin